jgi:hypothetical protein
MAQDKATYLMRPCYADSIWLRLIVRRDLQRALRLRRGTVAAAARKNTTAGYRGPSALTAP